MYTKNLIRMPVMLMCFLLFGCGSSVSSIKVPVDYHVKIVNSSGIELDDVEARMGKHVVAVGILIDGGSGQHSFFNHPIPDEVTVSFIKGEFDPDKKQPSHTRKAEIKLPKESFKTIVYSINNELEIDVSFEK